MNYHFIGLGGIGMSALARILLQKGCKVRGSDAQASPLLEQLKQEGAIVQVGHDAAFLQAQSTVVASTDIKESNVEIAKAKEMQMPLLHRSDLLDRLMQGKKALLVTGTHGKTTTTALLSAVLLEANLDPSFVVGGILSSLNTNGRYGKGEYFAAEADESDGSFLKTPSFGAIVTNLENDHLNYWGTEEKLDAAFRQFFGLAFNPQHIFWCCDDPRLTALHPKGVSYGFSEKAELAISRFRTTERGISFDLSFKGTDYPDVQLALWGRHNALNGASVFGLALSLGIPEAAIRSAFLKFGGTIRRLEWKGEAHKVSLYDDYGHHPTEIAAVLKALRSRIRERRLVAVFQPHRYTRVRDLFEEFCHCFHEADLVVLTDIYGAGEAPIEGITSARLYAQMREKLGAKLLYFPRAHLETGMAHLLQPLDAVLTLGAGDVTKAGEPILKLYAERAPKLKVAILCGGTSAEHSVSLMSARNIAGGLDNSIYEPFLFGITKQGKWIAGPDAIDRLEKNLCLNQEAPILPTSILQDLSRCDICIPVLHGPQGEDGMTQGLLDTLQIPYVGCDYRSGALCMQKSWTKHLAVIHGVPTPPFFEMDAVTYRNDPALMLHKIEEKLSYPVWIKAVHLGSSLGVSRADSPQDVARCAENAFTYDDTVIVEKHVEGRQIEFSVLGNEMLRTALPAEILCHGAFYDFDRKYGSNADGVQIPPADLFPLQIEIGKELAETMFKAIGGRGLARIDFFFDRNGHYWLNEINPFPGFTPNSGYPKMWEASGLSLTKLCDELIALGLQRSRKLAEIRGR